MNAEFQVPNQLHSTREKASSDSQWFFEGLTRWGLRFSVLVCLLLSSVARGDEIHSAIDHVQARMVKLYGAGGLKNLASYGTGFIVSPDGHIVTVWSHLLDADTVAVVLHDGRRLFGRVIGTDAKKDLAVLKIDATDLSYFDLAQSTSTGPGSLVLAFSNMFKVAVGDEPVTVTHGIVSARTDLSARR